ncbi:MAG: type IV pilus modification PilV family protein [Akkermansiaceae bacterium]
MNIFPVRSRFRNGFTMIEVVIALGLMSALVILCARLATANIQLANGISQQQSQNTMRESFFDMLKMQLTSLPGNTRMELRYTKGVQPYEYTLVLQNVPLAFTWGGVERIAKAVEICGVKRRDGFINVVMRYYENPVLTDAEDVADVMAEEPFAEVILMEDLRFFEWRALDGRTGDWQLDWDLQGRLPLQLELVTAQGAYGDEMKQIFWLVPKVSPATVIRGNGMNQQPGGTGGSGNGGGDIVIPGGVVGPGGTPGGVVPGGGVRPGGDSGGRR